MMYSIENLYLHLYGIECVEQSIEMYVECADYGVVTIDTC